MEPIINESEGLRHEEREQSADNDILITSTTLHVPGREEFDGFYMCAANSTLNNGWSTSTNDVIQVEFECKWSRVHFVNLWFIQFVEIKK